MAPDLYAGTVYGFKSLVKSWKVFSSAFQDVRVELECVDQIAVNSLIAVTTTSITVSETSLSCMFPQLSARVAAKLLHQRLVLHGSVRFEWDRVNNCVASLITRADMMSPLLEVLGCLEDVSLVFTNARIQPDGNVVTED
ncbi:hypothetical protein PHMEG_0008253 [Phytophthora megakarya]|uniref:Bzip transcription factor n=1 Tax=Phytophthora megakarya TaxID=4795 RepID=A0A225WJ79_9STRA|nr:hypothetical protein PHMEG_0008253 [Phytophthora megakarya]